MFDHGQPTYAEVNRDVLGSMLETGPRYWMLLGTTMTIAGVCFLHAVDIPANCRRRCIGYESKCALGHLPVEFHFLDRSQSLRDLAVSRAAHYQQPVAQIDLPQCRGDDSVLADDCGTFRYGPCGAGVVRALELSRSRIRWGCGQIFARP